jgi:hypothetical protein
MQESGNNNFQLPIPPPLNFSKRNSSPQSTPRSVIDQEQVLLSSYRKKLHEFQKHK